MQSFFRGLEAPNENVSGDHLMCVAEDRLFPGDPAILESHVCLLSTGCSFYGHQQGQVYRDSINKSQRIISLCASSVEYSAHTASQRERGLLLTFLCGNTPATLG